MACIGVHRATLHHMTYKAEQLSIRVPTELAEDLDALAKRQQRSRSDYVRLKLQEVVDKSREAGHLPPRKTS